MAFIRVGWRCDHVGVDEVCWRCTADIMDKRLERIRLHLQMIVRNESTIQPRLIAESALAEDDKFLDCAQGDHSFLDVTTVGSETQRLTPCIYCGAVPSS